MVGAEVAPDRPINVSRSHGSVGSPPILRKTAMDARAVTPILNVSDIIERVAWFEKLGRTKGFDSGSPPTFGSVFSRRCESFLCQGARGGRGKGPFPTTEGYGEAGNKGVWMSVWVDYVAPAHRHCLAQGIEVTM